MSSSAMSPGCGGGASATIIDATAPAASSRRRSSASPASGSEMLRVRSLSAAGRSSANSRNASMPARSRASFSSAAAMRTDDPLDQLVDERVEEGELELALRGEVLVDQGLRDPAAGGHVVEGSLVEPARGEDLERVLEDRRTAVGRREPAFGRLHGLRVLTDCSVSYYRE